ncbi:pantoate--beta-alanine ligase [Nevskia sp.]|uniref:pantoate--beta-alanine ligase n=1 Tax=Nevskia sp. TaxID=1929292 RepID=UPI0025F9403F|nr:pantoate--beta-alanine ligase [Nevskia sp.]
MKTLHTVAELQSLRADWRARGERVAVVPTMGNLHRGHLALVERAKQLAERVVVTIFVNPLQFGPNEDFGRYPRTLPEDLKALAGLGVDLVYAPPVEEVYVNGFPPATTITVAPLSSQLEGHFRPGFFTGVATVVAILFDSVQPDVAVFGEKDWQQLQIVTRMVADLRMGIAIVGHPTARDDDGLAMSSRNQYLNAEERARAPAVHASLQAVAAGLRAGRRDLESLCDEACAALRQQGFVPQYLEVRTPALDSPIASTRDFVVLVAAVLGTTRLIDNLRVTLD